VLGLIIVLSFKLTADLAVGEGPEAAREGVARFHVDRGADRAEDGTRRRSPDPRAP
jgi:hypothetical protein